MTMPSSNSPTLTEAMTLMVDAGLRDIHTAMPGTIVSYNVSKQTASVQLGFMRQYEGEENPTPYPVLTDVPVMFPAVKNGWLRLPVAAGDTVLVVFAERSIDNWLDAGGTQDPGGLEFYSVNDAIALPGLLPSAKVFAPKGDADSLELVMGGTRIEITKAGKVRISNGSTELLTVLDDILTHLQSWTSINCVVGSPVTPNPATLANLVQDQTKLRSLMP